MAPVFVWKGGSGSSIDIAFKDRVKPGLEQAATFFRKFRYLAMNPWYSTEPDMAEIGYIGNTPLAGDYPGPMPEALAHLDAALRQLGLV